MNAGNLGTTNLLLGIMAFVSVLEATLVHTARAAVDGFLHHSRRAERV